MTALSIILAAAVYGNLVNGEFVRAPENVNYGGANRITANLDERAANALGYCLLEDTPPAVGTNEYAVATGYIEYALTSLPPIPRIGRLYEVRRVEPPPRRWTPRSLYVAFGDRREEVKAALVAAGYWDEFVMSQVIDESNQNFAAGYNLACAKFGKEAVDAILASAEVEP